MVDIFEKFDLEESGKRKGLDNDLNARIKVEISKLNRKTTTLMIIEDILGNILGSNTKIEELGTKIKQDGVQFYLRNYMDNLVDYGFSEILDNPNDLEEYRKGVFNRIRWEFEYLDKERLIEDYRSNLVIRELFDYEQWRSYKGFKALNELFNLIIEKQLVSKRNGKKLRNMFDDSEVENILGSRRRYELATSRDKKGKKTIDAQEIKPKTKVVGDKKPEQIYDQNVEELLVECFDIPRSVAQIYAKITTEDNATTLYGELAELVGDERAERIIKDNPEVITYNNNGEWNKYQKALRYILKSKDIEYFDRLEIRSYSSLEALLIIKKRIPHNETETSNVEDETKEIITYDQINIIEYSFLNRKFPIIDSRLDSLMKNGIVEVDGKDHWTEQETGARGRNILMKIKFQMKKLYDKLGLEQPICSINFSNTTMEIDDTARENLKVIYQQLYS